MRRFQGALRIVRRRKRHNDAVELLGERRRCERRVLIGRALLAPDAIDRSRHGLPHQDSDLRCLRSILRQQLIGFDQIGGEHAEMRSLRVIGVLCRRNHQADQHRSQRRQKACAEPDHVLRTRTALVGGDHTPQKHAGHHADDQRDKGDQENPA